MTILSPHGTVSILVNAGFLKGKQKQAVIVTFHVTSPFNDENLIYSFHYIVK